MIPCERCHKSFDPIDLVMFEFNNINVIMVCLPCCKTVIEALLALPVEQRDAHLWELKDEWMRDAFTRTTTTP